MIETPDSPQIARLPVGILPLPKIVRPDPWPSRPPLVHQPPVICAPALWFRHGDVTVEGANMPAGTA